MRLIDPAFDLFELEREAKVIFENIYMQYLRAELADLSKVCGEVALAYFKVLLKKREVEVVAVGMIVEIGAKVQVPLERGPSIFPARFRARLN
jgi:hypothetical protein